MAEAKRAGAVTVLVESDSWVVGCFVTVFGEPHCPDPWVSEHDTRAAANVAAIGHRSEIQRFLGDHPDRCPTCGNAATTPAPEENPDA